MIKPRLTAGALLFTSVTTIEAAFFNSFYKPFDQDGNTETDYRTNRREDSCFYQVGAVNIYQDG